MQRPDTNVCAIFLVGLTACFSFATGCSKVTPKIQVSGIPPDAVTLDVNELGFKSADKLQTYVATTPSDGHMIDAHCLKVGCDIVELTLYVKNTSHAVMAPPVVRVQPRSEPEGKLTFNRVPLAFQREALQPLETGRLRWLLSLAPHEKAPVIHLSGSIAFGVITGN